MTEQKETKKRNKGGGKKLRDNTVRALAANGHTHDEIAEQMGLRRQQIGRILSNKETQELIKLGEDRIKLLMTKAIDTLEYALDQKNEFQQLGHAIKSAVTVLKSLGVVKEKVEMEHSFPKPTVIKRADGSEVVLGFKGEGDDEDSD